MHMQMLFNGMPSQLSRPLQKLSPQPCCFPALIAQQRAELMHWLKGMQRTFGRRGRMREARRPVE